MAHSHIRRSCSAPAEDSKYVTLSYCWGGSSFVKLISANLESLRQEMPTSVLPKTFQEALHVTRRLGCGLLWIESLCVLQDSPSDWYKESSGMADIYSNAVCSNIATGSWNPHKGLFRDRDPTVIAPFTFQTDWKDEASHLLVTTDVDAYSHQTGSAPIAFRAWLLQERLLPQRLLHLRSEQIF
jgi:Heterokaryon incompatibility protein (HET)